MSGDTLIVAGGGTGGHVLAGVAVADAWRASFGAQARGWCSSAPKEASRRSWCLGRAIRSSCSGSARSTG